MAFMTVLLLTNTQPMGPTARKPRSCRRLLRNTGWWENAWSNFDDKRFKRNFRVSRATFLYILGNIEGDLEKELSTDFPISPAFRLAVCLYRLARGDYLHTVAELVGLGTTTVANIVNEVCSAIIARLWEVAVHKHFPKTAQELQDIMISFEEDWQFPCCFGAVDGCHLPIKCPKGGAESAKEHHNFKNFYSIVLMAIVDAKYRFMWASSGFPGNSHDAIIFQSTQLFQNIGENNDLRSMSKREGTTNIYPLIVGDSAFPFSTWLMKPYSNAILTPEQRYFNYRLSRARMVTEGAYGQLKGRWRVLLRKCECSVDTVKIMSLACVVLHNICIDLEAKAPIAWDLRFDANTQQKRPREAVRELLSMRNCRRMRDTSVEAKAVRECLKSKFWSEKQGQGVH